MREFKETHRTLLHMRTADLALYSAGEERCAPGYAYPPRLRPYHLVHFVLSGSGTLEIGGRMLALEAGDAFIIPANTLARYQASEHDPWHYAWIGFLGIQSEGYVQQLTGHLPETYALRHLDLLRYRVAIEELIGLRGDPSTSSFFMATSILNRIVAFLFSEVPHVEESWGQRSVADEARFYLDMNFFEPLKMDDVAAELGVSPGYLARTFKERFGLSPKRYATELKLERAAALLETTDLPVAVVAGAVGFDDQLAFSKAFKKERGASPTAWRRMSHAPAGRRDIPDEQDAS